MLNDIQAVVRLFFLINRFNFCSVFLKMYGLYCLCILVMFSFCIVQKPTCLIILVSFIKLGASSL